MSKIQLRAIEPFDIDLIYLWENDHEVWEVSNTITPFSRYTLEQYILSAASSDIYSAKQLRLMIDVCENESIKTVGTIDLFDFDPHHSRAGMGILIDGKERGKEYAKQALNKLIEYAFDTLQIHQLYCNIHKENERSLCLFQNAGFEIIGVKKDWLRIGNSYKDEYLLQLIRK